MRYILTLIKAVCLLASIVFLQGCERNGIIGKKTMASIIEEMYLADQYIEQNPYLRAQTDSLSVYPAIVARYGHTMEEYSNSIRYWLQKDKEYENILRAAQASMDKRVAELDVQIAEIEKLRRGPQRWWALDSVRSVAPQEFLYDHLLRGVRWLVLPSEQLQKWTAVDSALVDIPQNPVWWSNNMAAKERDFLSVFLRGVNTKARDDVKKDMERPVAKPKNLKLFTKTDVTITQELEKEKEERIQKAF